jgi:four helix bundle protein
VPHFELYEEGGQVRRSSKGVTSCIVEGYGRKKYRADLVKFLVYAHASCDETILHLNFLKDAHESTASECVALVTEYNELGARINRFIQYVEKEWNRHPAVQPAT